ncbi:RNA-binding protein [Vallitalea pronyensis]|uniref:RNA-binding protein n=1 Tax=Vallitalea pronyensis TaxID=1348613 RepID=A0A8J8SH13_9FIRM|nr:YlmH/Sll1252 family protein [Vallitalea pronyensis]QUI23365.1 RNA-binding protein [Vallitalea pronyensis]
MLNIKDEQLVVNHIMNKGKLAGIKHCNVFTDFLTLYEQNLFLERKHELNNIHYAFYGGYDDSERKIIAFYPDYMQKNDLIYPIDAISIYPKNAKFSNKLTHRDYLGSILGLGITRAKVGDILVKENRAIAFVNHTIASYIQMNLNLVKQTVVTVEQLDAVPLEIIKPQYKDIQGTVPSVRLDAVIGLAFPLSRAKAAALIKSKTVYVNSRLILSSSYQLAEGDIVSVRGMGKFLLDNIGNRTKKDRILIVVKRYT